MIDTTNMTDRQVNLLARWDSLEGGPFGTPASEIDPETAVLVEEDGVVTKVSSEEELAAALALLAGLTLDEFADPANLNPGVRVIRGGIRNL